MSGDTFIIPHEYEKMVYGRENKARELGIWW
jgi:hypothetical protein